jgi:phage terminase small subunit
MAEYMRVTPSGEPFLDFSGLTRDQTAALQEVTVDRYVEGGGEAARDVKRVRLKLADKRAALVGIGRHLGMFKERHEELNAHGPLPHNFDSRGAERPAGAMFGG